jgi:hypothetical protein
VPCEPLLLQKRQHGSHHQKNTVDVSYQQVLASKIETVAIEVVKILQASMARHSMRRKSFNRFHERYDAQNEFLRSMDEPRRFKRSLQSVLLLHKESVCRSVNIRQDGYQCLATTTPDLSGKNSH